MSSFMSVANERLDNIAGVLRDHDQLVHNVLRSVSHLNNDISILRTVVESAVSNITNFISKLSRGNLVYPVRLLGSPTLPSSSGYP